MAYATYSDVASEFKNITFSSTSSVKDTEVTEFLVQADAYIDSVLGTKYTTPITGSVSLSIVKRLSIWLVTGRIKNILRVKSGQPLGEQDVEDDLAKLAREELRDIVKGLILLPDATLASSSDGFRSYNVDEGEEYTFEKNVDQW